MVELGPRIKDAQHRSNAKPLPLSEILGGNTPTSLSPWPTVFRLSLCGSVAWSGRSPLTGTSSKPVLKSFPKNRLAAEAGYDVDQFFTQLQAWSDAHLHAHPVVRSAEELRRLAARESALALKDQPRPKD
jgi:hypothetical protein